VCTSEPTGKFRCEIIETACTLDSECPSGWTCADNSDRAVCYPEPCPVDPTQPVKVCQPPYWDLGGRAGGSLDEGGSTFAPVALKASSGSSSSSDSDSSCQVAPALGAASGGTASAGIFGLLLATALRRRRERH
jgi:MYXO-CTERM domain-containing protein